MARSYRHILTAVVIALALLDGARWLPPLDGHCGTRALAQQNNLIPQGYDSNMGGYGGPGGAPAYDPTAQSFNNYGPTGPTPPVAAVRPDSWPGGSPQQAPPPGGVPMGAPPAGYPPVATAPPIDLPKKDPTQPPYEPAAIMARVGSEVVQAAEILPTVHQMLDQFVTKLGPDFEKLPNDVKQERLDSWKRELVERTLDDAIKIKLLLAEVKGTVPEEGLKKNVDRIRRDFNENEIRRQMEQYKAGSVIDLENKLRAQGGSLESQRTVYVERMLAISWLHQQVKEQKEPTHEDMVRFYRDHATDWDKPARARWEVLTAKFDEHSSKEEARRAIAQWGNEVLRGAPFGQVASAHSQHFSSEEGGLNDWTTQGSLRSTVLDQAIFGLPIGALSQILEDDEGYHILRVVEREERRRIPFNEVQPEIKQRLKDGDMQDAKQQYVAKLREHYPVWSVFDDSDSSLAKKQGAGRR